MKRTGAVLLAGLMCLTTSCQNFLDVNTNPNAPQTVSAYLYLAPMLHWMATSPQYDGRYVGRYAQEWVYRFSSSSQPYSWDRMGYDAASDAGAQQWRDVYWSLGQNLVDMNTLAEQEQRWDLLGVGLILKAWGWQVLTDMHGPIIIKEAFDQTRTTFDYDTEEYAYQEVDSLLNAAIVLLQRTDGAVDQGYLAQGDHMYNGDRAKWLKLAYGMLALNLNHFSNKASYNPDSVIALVDKSFTSNDDDALFPYPAASANDDKNFLGTSRDNITRYRQTEFIVHLMDGTEFGGVVDPRMSRMLSPSPDGQYRGLNPLKKGFSGLSADQIPNNFYGYPGTAGAGQPSRYIFSDKSKIPVMTYSQLQFIKAEAAYRKGDKATALAAYINGISSHIDFVNARNQDDGQTPTQITDAEKQAFLSNPAIVPATADGLTLSHIMSQKYIAEWGWGHNELWMDLRRYHYTDMDPASGTEVFRGFTPPSGGDLFTDNGGKLVQRMRPRYNSEYVWNQAGLEPIGGLNADYHTYPLWITQP
ncbi:MAG TPA: RagB/SusD family nutrient uptake outer membrane protein [Gemmatimonadaceae bacterium]